MDNNGAYSPATHVEHCVAPVSTPVDEPSSHAKHVEAPALGAYSPAGHAMHASTTVAPGDALALPGTHDVHDARSAASYLPATHCEHDDERASATNPAKHGVHTLDPLDTPVELPAAHTPHTDAPSSLAYVPSSHAWHASMDVERSLALKVPAGHATHCDCAALA